MSKIGRKPIPLGNTNVSVDANEVTYKGTGIRYVDEVIKRKAGKSKV